MLFAVEEHRSGPVLSPAVGEKYMCAVQGQRNQSSRALWPQLLGGDEPSIHREKKKVTKSS